MMPKWDTKLGACQYKEPTSKTPEGRSATLRVQGVVFFPFLFFFTLVFKIGFSLSSIAARFLGSNISYCVFQGRKINFTNSKTLVGRCHALTVPRVIFDLPEFEELKQSKKSKNEKTNQKKENQLFFRKKNETKKSKIQKWKKQESQKTQTQKIKNNRKFSGKEKKRPPRVAQNTVEVSQSITLAGSRKCQQGCRSS